jgi:NAD-dependent SIR2 family protein deacetylase
MMDESVEKAIQAAADAVRTAEALLIGAGAGIGVDSGLPDFRGNAGFWAAYPPFKKLGLSFIKLANPYWFRSDPELAWGFYGHRRNLYRATEPHAGFAILLAWARQMPAGAFVFTSNVDGHFQKAGFSDEQVVECHGSLEHLQCVGVCNSQIWPAAAPAIEINDQSLRALQPLPNCPSCGRLARPNVLMFADAEWLPARTNGQIALYERWRRSVQNRRLVVIEIGAGMAVPTVRIECEAAGHKLIRINPRQYEVTDGGISLPLGALEGLRAIDACLSRASGE